MNNIPEINVPVLAKINKGLTTWYDVLIFCKNNVWKYQFDLSHLTNNESVIDWVYCENVEFNDEFTSVPKQSETEKNFWCEEYECATMYLNDLNIPLKNETDTYSLRGRIKLLGLKNE